MEVSFDDVPSVTHSPEKSDSSEDILLNHYFFSTIGRKKSENRWAPCWKVPRKSYRMVNGEVKKTYEYIRNEDGTFTCPHCKVVKRLQSTMHEHYDSHHSGTFKHKCKWCQFETSKKQTLDKHIGAKHPERLDVKPKEFHCPHDDCSYACLNKGGLRSHYLLKHMADTVKKYLSKGEQEGVGCSHCGKEFASKPAFVYHLAGCLPEDTLKDTKVREGLGI